MWKHRALVVCAGIFLAMNAAGQSGETFKTRLAPVAIDGTTKGAITGGGSASAVLSGSKLTVTGKFEGLKSNATMAHIHQGSAPGVRGPKLLDLTVTKGMSGDLSGSFDLTPEQVQRLKKGDWYVQIHSEKVPEGNLWGWLFK